MTDRPSSPIPPRPRGTNLGMSLIVRFLAAFVIGGVLALAIRWAWSFHWSVGAMAAYAMVLSVVVLFFGTIYARRGRRAVVADRR